MASSAPSTPRRRLLSRDIDVDSSSPNEHRSRLPSYDIPRTYSGLYGAGVGAPDIPVDFDNSDSKYNGMTTSINNAISNIRPASSKINPPSLQQNQCYHSKKVRKSNHYQEGSNLLPFELSRNRNTDWIAAGGPTLLLTYIFIVLIALLTFLAFVPEPKVAWALTNVAHMLVTLVYLHWIKGNPADYMDGTQGEMNAMTLWEQIVSTPAIYLHKRSNSEENAYNTIGRNMSLESRMRGSGRDVLVIIPTLLALLSCYVAEFQFHYAVINVFIWGIVMIPKLPCMNGVRILGINRTAGIDDGDDQEGFDNDDCVDTEDESAQESIRFDLDSCDNIKAGVFESKKIR